MRATRAVAVAAVCAAILLVGYVAAPEPLAPLELVTPASTSGIDTTGTAP